MYRLSLGSCNRCNTVALMSWACRIEGPQAHVVVSRCLVLNTYCNHHMITSRCLGLNTYCNHHMITVLEWRILTCGGRGSCYGVERNGYLVEQSRSKGQISEKFQPQWSSAVTKLKLIKLVNSILNFCD